MEAHKQRLIERGGGSGSEADGESESEDEEWNTMDGTTVTSDGDIIRIPGTPSKSKGEGSSRPGGAVTPTPILGRRGSLSGERTREEISALAASKRELSD